MSRRVKQAGMTLVELMVVVMIIGVSALAFLPGIGRALAEHDKEQAVRELWRTALRGRNDSIGQRRAYLMWIQYSTSLAVAPRVQLLRAATTSCVAQDWTSMQAQCGNYKDEGRVLGTPTSTTHLKPCIASFDFNNDTRYAGSGFGLYAVEEDVNGATSTQNRSICFSPDGALYAGTSLTLTNMASYNTVNGAIKLLISLRDKRNNLSGQERLVIPVSGTPKVLK